MRSRSRLLLVPTLLAAAIALAGCSIGGGSSADDSGSSKSDSSSSKDDASPAADDTAASGGCPASITTALKSQTDSSTTTAEGTVDDLAFPGDPALVAEACILTVDTGAGTSVMAFVPGEADAAAGISAAIETAGFTVLTSDENSTFYTKDKESWIVATSAASNPLSSAFGDKFSGPIITVMHIVTT
ncbi:hypothetical protein [Schumannella sp. 10F1B-5-1]|uniref:hypothetical protein n=1 Tax=Schumannella sp. 10F1B-5-1 TaxID=2590780 RepID=UPI0011311C4B|nr:hypothetical protein [Schumannella sp. 10F1B-5-1]TPW72332.1 hypothetical protein FJ658_08670 [Schumannella sp. 10F1B-5-1]